MMPEDSIDRCIEHLYHWQYSRSDSFSAHLFQLIMKADSNNRLRLLDAFPNHFTAWQMWWNAPDDRAFFRQRGIPVDLGPKNDDVLAKGNVD